MALPKIQAEEIRGVLALMPTPAKQGADRWDSEKTVDLEEAARLTESFVSSGVDAILLNGTLGECATLTWEELQDFTDTVVNVVRGRVPVFAGATTMNTRDTIRRARAFSELGADGLFLGRPMWVALDDYGIVRFYRDVSEALPHLAIVLYDNPGAFKGKISPKAYAELAKIPQVVASKHMGLLLGEDVFFSDLNAVQGRIRLLPLELEWYSLAKVAPEQVVACWSGFCACGLAPAISLRDAIFAQDWDLAQSIHQDMEWATETFFPEGDFRKFALYSIQIDKIRDKAAEYFRPGPSRPPYTNLPASYEKGAAECGRRWKALQEKYAKQVAANTPR